MLDTNAKMSSQVQNAQTPSPVARPEGPWVPQSTILRIDANPGVLKVGEQVKYTRDGGHEGCRECQRLWRVVPVPGAGEAYLVRLPDWVLPPRQDVHGWWFCSFRDPRWSPGFYMEHHFPPDTLDRTRKTHQNRCGVLEWRPHMSWAELEESSLSWRLHKLAVPYGEGPTPLYSAPVFPERPKTALDMTRSASQPDPVSEQPAPPPQPDRPKSWSQSRRRGGN